MCTFDYRTYQDQAVYELNLFAPNVTGGLQQNCTIEKLRKGRYDEWPLVILGSLILSAICFHLVKDMFINHLGSKRRHSDLIENGLGRLDSTIKHSNDLNSTRPKRSVTVDVFRGFVILLMIFVNYGAGGYVFLEHAPWFGLTIAGSQIREFNLFFFNLKVTSFYSLHT